ncbi:MAG: ParB-like nuclease domain [Bacteriophage sp.]|nr:MAG: ParB-like nuclease domain [Bacteriophage sp.]
MKTMAKFDLKGLLNDRSVPDRQQDQKIVYRNPKDLTPSEENFYNTEKLERLKQSIKLLGILQPLLIENRDGKDYVIAGHCRRKCCIDLLNEGNDRFSRVPCIYKTQSELEQDAGQEDDIVRQIMIIQANCYRDKSDWEKMTETLKMEGLVKELREKTPMEGKTRDILKDLIGTSGGQLGRYHAISTNLCEQLMSEFEEDRIKISVAYEASKLNREHQKQACELYEETGILTLDDIRDLYRQQEAEKGIPGQMTIETATGQNRPPEDDTEIPAETQIERFYESTNKNMKNYIIQEDKNMTIFMLSNLYGSACVRNGHLNYQGSTAGITFNPGGVFEHELSWQSLAKILIGKHGHKKPVKMVPVDTPEKTKKKDNEVSGPAKCITGKSKSGICGAAAYCDTEYKCCAQCPDACNSRCGWLEERCQPAAETPDEKQQDFVEDTKIADHPGETTALPTMKNNDQRKEWLRNYKAWGLWYEDKNIGVKYYKYDFKNGARLIVEEYAPDPVDRNSWWVSRSETYYMHLVGGPEPERGVPKWTYHTRYNKYPNSETELIEFLKEVQKNG